MGTKIYDLKEFVRNEHLPQRKPPVFSLLPLAVAPLVPSVAYAEETVISRMMNAFEPLIDLIQGMAYPVAMVCVLGGAIFITIGNSEKGFSMMQKAGLGYLVVMISPMIFDVLVDAVDGAV